MRPLALPPSRSRRSGVTLIELLIAMTVFAVVIALAGAGVVQILRLQRLNEGIMSAQAKMRRITQVVAQDLRTSSMGGLVDTPYESGATSLSVTSQDGPWYTVLPHDSGQNASFVAAANVQIRAPASSAAELGLADRDVLMTNGNGQGIVLPITTVSRRGGPSSDEWNLVHPGCANTIDYTGASIGMNRIRLVGYALDVDTERLLRREGNGDAVPVAFGVRGFALSYVYRDETDGSVDVRPVPIENGAGHPVRTPTISGTSHVLEAVNIELTIVADEGREVVRSLSTNVALPDPVPATPVATEVCR